MPVVRSVALVYNLPGLPSNFTLVLSRSAIADIFAGNITWWNDTTLAELNPGVILPAESIILVVRKDSSGTSQIMTAALSSFSSFWASTYGIFSSSSWPFYTYKGMTSTGVVGIVGSLPYSFGYVDQDSAVQDQLKYAAIINKAGNTILPTVVSVQAAVDAHENSFTNLTRFTTTIADGSGADAYPLVAFSYYIVRKTLTGNCTEKLEMLRFFYYALYDQGAAGIAVDNYFVTMPTPLADLVASVLGELTCSGVHIFNTSTSKTHATLRHPHLHKLNFFFF